MNIFDAIDTIAFSKKTVPPDSVDMQSTWQPYMVNRWLSMLDGSAATIINATVNKYHQVFANKQDYLQFMTQVMPRYRKQKIQYIKKMQVD